MAASLQMQRAVAPDRFNSHKRACLTTSRARALARHVSQLQEGLYCRQGRGSLGPLAHSLRHSIATPPQHLPCSVLQVAMKLRHFDYCIIATQVPLHQGAFGRPSDAGGQRLQGVVSASTVSAPTNDNPFLG